MQRKDQTPQKLNYLRDNIENFQFIAAYGLSGNKLYAEFVAKLEKPGMKADAVITYMNRIIKELTVPITEEGKSVFGMMKAKHTSEEKKLEFSTMS